MPKLRPKKKFDPAHEKAMENAERCFAKSAALMTGVSKLITEIGGTSWGDSIVLDVCLELLQDAKVCREDGMRIMKRVKS